MINPLEHVPTVPVDPLIHDYTQFGAYYEPLEYTGWRDESMSWKRTCYIGDWSGLVKILIAGPDALRFFSDITVNSLAAFEIGQAKHAVFCNDAGQVMGEGILMRWSEHELFLTSGPGAKWAQYRFGLGSWNASCTVLTDAMSIQQIQGPTSRAVMEEAIGESLDDLRFMRFRQASIDGKEFLILRQGMSGDIGFEIHGKTDEAADVYSRIMEVGASYGIRRLGGRTKMVNHVEASFPTPGVDYIPAWYDIDDVNAFKESVPPMLWQRMQSRSGSFGDRPLSAFYRTPYELGWGRNVKFDHEFIGADALRREAELQERSLRTLVWDADDVADVVASYFRTNAEPYEFMEWPRGLLGNVEASTVTQDGAEIGFAMSRCYSLHFRQMLSLAVLRTAGTEVGSRVEVVWGPSSGPQKTINATIVATPYKQDNRRAAVGPASAGVVA